MSTESGKTTCEKCEYESVGLEDIARIGDPTGRVILCPLHSSEMAGKLAECLKSGILAMNGNARKNWANGARALLDAYEASK